MSPSHRIQTNGRAYSLARALCLASTFLACGLGTAFSEAMIPSNAFITSIDGNVPTVDSEGDSVSLKTHKNFLPAGHTFSTGKKEQLFLAFSNGLSLGMDESTELICIEYSQRPFSERKQGFEFEPSVSNLTLRLVSGEITISSSHISPLSKIRILLPKGEIRLHQGTCLIRHDSMGLHITAYEGNLSYFYPNDGKREYIYNPYGVRISDQSAERQEVVESFTTESLNEDEVNLCLAAQHASERVTFEANDITGQPPRPVLVVRPEYYEQPSIRPYQFRD